MTASHWAAVAAAEYRSGRPLALLFDYDGTLTPIVPHPALAALPASTREALDALAGLPGVAVGVVSGRSLLTLRGFVGLPRVRYAGSGGMHLDLAGEEAVDPALAAFDRIADALVTALSVPVKWFPGAWVERKPGCLSVHYRALTPLKAACFLEEARDALAELGPDCPPLRLREVSRALEVGLAGAWTKGDAVARMLGAGAPEPFAVYAGDGANDEEAVAAVNARRGLTVGVGPEAPDAAGLRLADQAEFEAGLFHLTATLCGGEWPPRPARPGWPGGGATGQPVHQGVR
jgi:trehalose-phosphatase